MNVIDSDFDYALSLLSIITATIYTRYFANRQNSFTVYLYSTIFTSLKILTEVIQLIKTFQN